MKPTATYLALLTLTSTTLAFPKVPAITPASPPITKTKPSQPLKPTGSLSNPSVNPACAKFTPYVATEHLSHVCALHLSGCARSTDTRSNVSSTTPTWAVGSPYPDVITPPSSTSTARQAVGSPYGGDVFGYPGFPDHPTPVLTTACVTSTAPLHVGSPYGDVFDMPGAPDFPTPTVTTSCTTFTAGQPVGSPYGGDAFF